MNYFRVWLICAGTVVLSVVVFNFVVDPFGIWHGWRIEGFNKEKPQKRSKERIYKVGAYAREPVPNIILGSSIAEISLYPELLPGGGINLATVGQRLGESTRLLEWASRQTRLRHVLYSAEFFISNMCLNELEGLRESDLASPKGYQYLMSVSTLGESVGTLSKQSQSAILKRRNMLSEDGIWIWNDGNVEYPAGMRSKFIESEGFYNYFPAPLYCYSFEQAGRSTEQYLRRMFGLAYGEQLDFRLVISPSHARERELILGGGLWEKWEDWKRLLVRINEDEARKSGREPFAIWDFSDYNSITTEDVPPAGDKSTRMRWYWDTIHYRQVVGEMMFNRVYGTAVMGTKPPRDFGKRITSQNIEAWLIAVRRSREIWAQSHPEDVREVAQSRPNPTRRLRAEWSPPARAGERPREPVSNGNTHDQPDIKRK